MHLVNERFISNLASSLYEKNTQMDIDSIT